MEEEEQLETFMYTEVIEGKEHFYSITAKDAHYVIEMDGCIIAKVLCDGEWKQVSGEPISDLLIRELGDHIEDHNC